jgi:hypothetical protein
VAVAFGFGYHTGRTACEAENERLRDQIDRGGLPALDRFRRALDVIHTARANRLGWPERLP